MSERQILEAARAIVAEASSQGAVLHHEDRVAAWRRAAKELERIAQEQHEINEQFGVPDRFLAGEELVAASSVIEIKSLHIYGNVTYRDEDGNDEVYPVLFERHESGSLVCRAPVSGHVVRWSCAGRYQLPEHGDTVAVDANDYLVLAPIVVT